MTDQDAQLGSHRNYDPKPSKRVSSRSSESSYNKIPFFNFEKTFKEFQDHRVNPAFESVYQQVLQTVFKAHEKNKKQKNQVKKELVDL